jgi:hypothetical protein
MDFDDEEFEKLNGNTLKRSLICQDEIDKKECTKEKKKVHAGPQENEVMCIIPCALRLSRCSETLLLFTFDGSFVEN